MRWPTEHEAQVIEDNLTGWRDTQSLVEFRRIFPRTQHSAFTRAVLALNNSGVDFTDAQWAAGQATCHLPEGASFPEVLATAKNILEAYRHAA